MRCELAKYGAMLVVMIALTGGAEAGCACGGGSSGTWSGQSWIEEPTSEESNDFAESNGTEAETAAEGTVAVSDGDDRTSISAQELKLMLELRQTAPDAWQIPVVKTIAINHDGIDELAEISEVVAASLDSRARLPVRPPGAGAGVRVARAAGGARRPGRRDGASARSRS